MFNPRNGVESLEPSMPGRHKQDSPQDFGAPWSPAEKQNKLRAVGLFHVGPFSMLPLSVQGFPASASAEKAESGKVHSNFDGAFELMTSRATGLELLLLPCYKLSQANYVIKLPGIALLATECTKVSMRFQELCLLLSREVQALLAPLD